jgi:hypothetical protein
MYNIIFTVLKLIPINSPVVSLIFFINIIFRLFSFFFRFPNFLNYFIFRLLLIMGDHSLSYFFVIFVKLTKMGEFLIIIKLEKLRYY